MNRIFRILLILSVIILPLLVFRTGAEDNAAKKPPAMANTLYDPDPNHLWNRLYAALFIRTGRDGTEYGFDSLDPLLWPQTKHLLDGESHKQAIRVLDEFLDKHGENLIRDPLKRAILQRDLWSVFDWYWQNPEERADRKAEFPVPAKALAERLAKIIRRLALTREQIEALPDNYASAVSAGEFPGAFDPAKPDALFLPSGLFDKDGPWVCVESDNGLTAPAHTYDSGGRSAFLIFIRLPGDRAETLDYVKKLADFPEPRTYDRALIDKTGADKMALVMPHSFNRGRPPWINPGTPQFPPGTQFALVRRMLLIDGQGNIVPTSVTLSVQVRVYKNIDYSARNGGGQSANEFILQRNLLFAGKAGGFHAVSNEDLCFSTFLSTPNDPIDDGRKPDIALDCMGCHDGAGIHSVLSHSQLFAHPVSPRPPVYSESDPQRIAQFTIDWKRQRFTWGYLTGLWALEN